MSKKELKFYPNMDIVKISRRAEERNDDAFRVVRYLSWESAHAHMVLHAESKIKNAMTTLQRAINYQRGVLNMRKPSDLP